MKLLEAGASGSDPDYTAICADTEFAARLRNYVESLWLKFERYADSKFREQIRSNFHACFFEMYVANCLLQHYSLTSEDSGPDLFLPEPGIWLECTTVSNGDAGLPDSVPRMRTIGPDGETTAGESRYPFEKIVMRYTQAIREKAEKFRGYVCNGKTNPNQPCIIAVNGARLHFGTVDPGYPPILAALFPIKRQYVYVGDDPAQRGQTGFHYGTEVTKQSGAPIETLAFEDQRCAHISGVVYSAADVVNRCDPPGSDFLLVPNPFAKNPIDPQLLKVGKYVQREQNETKVRFNFLKV